MTRVSLTLIRFLMLLVSIVLVYRMEYFSIEVTVPFGLSNGELIGIRHLILDSRAKKRQLLHCPTHFVVVSIDTSKMDFQYQ